MLTIIAIEILTNGRIEILFIPCPQCGLTHTLTVRKDEFEDYICGVKHLQDCFPNLLPAQLELFQTGIDGECWKQMAEEARKEEEGEDAVPPGV